MQLNYLLIQHLMGIAIFLIILSVGLAYVWVKTDLEWVKRKVKYASGRYENLKQ